MSKQKQFVCTTFSELVVFMYLTGKSMSYCGLVDARIRASNKDLPVNVRFEKQLTQLTS